MRANFALPLILPWPRAISTGNWNWPHNSLVCQSHSICTSWRMPNWSGPIPDPVTSVRLPHSAPAPNASCMSENSLQAPLQLFLGGKSVVPGRRHLGHRRSGKMIGPPALHDVIERSRRGRDARRPRNARGGGLFHGQLLLEAEDLDRDDRDRLVAEHPLIGFDFTGDVGVLHCRRQADVLQPGSRQWRERRLDAIDQRIEHGRRRHIRVARMRVHIELDDERPYRRRAERRHRCELRLLAHEQRRLLCGSEAAPVTQSSRCRDEIGRSCDEREQRGIDRLARDHNAAASSAESVAVAPWRRAKTETGARARYCESSSFTSSLMSCWE